MVPTMHTGPQPLQQHLGTEPRHTPSTAGAEPPLLVGGPTAFAAAIPQGSPEDETRGSCALPTCLPSTQSCHTAWPLDVLDSGPYLAQATASGCEIFPLPPFNFSSILSLETRSALLLQVLLVLPPKPSLSPLTNCRLLFKGVFQTFEKCRNDEIEDNPQEQTP